MAKSVVVDCMTNTIQVMFYACDYSTKPNMTCAPLLAAIWDGIRRLEEQLQKEERSWAKQRIVLAEEQKAMLEWELARVQM